MHPHPESCNSLGQNCHPSLDHPRAISEIVYSCLMTLVLCSSYCIRPNMSAPCASRSRVVIRKLIISLWMLVFPEVVVAWAFRQWYQARKLAKRYEGMCQTMIGCYCLVNHVPFNFFASTRMDNCARSFRSHGWIYALSIGEASPSALPIEIQQALAFWVHRISVYHQSRDQEKGERSSTTRSNHLSPVIVVHSPMHGSWNSRTHGHSNRNDDTCPYNHVCLTPSSVVA
jgi:hypothetical protein